MTSAIIASFIMMLIAAGLGFAIAWVFKSERNQAFVEKYRKNKSLATRLKEEQESLIQHSNSLQSEKLKLTQKLEKQAKRMQAMKEMLQQLEEDKEFVFNEYEKFKKEVRGKLEKWQQLSDSYEDLKVKNQKVKIKADKWKIKLHEIQEQLAETEASYLKIKREKEQVLEKLSDSPVDANDLLEWESNYKELKLQFLALSKEKGDLVKELESLKTKSKNVPIDKLSQELVLLKKENQALKKKQISIEDDVLENKSSVLDRIKSRRKHVEFSRIGKGNAKEKDNLKKLKGLGPLMEQKFNAIGINTYEQLASLNQVDVKLLAFLLELSQGKIENEKWVEQAKALVNKHPSNATLQQISGTIDKINFSKIGQASPTQKDDLQTIHGIGPYIEQKLNAIGIFRFEQLAKLSREDIEEINNIMELAPGHVQKDDWVGQAQRMK